MLLVLSSRGRLARRMHDERADRKSTAARLGLTLGETGTDGANLDRGPACGRALARDGDRLVARRDVHQEETADHLLGFGEWSVDQPRLPTADLHPRRAGIGRAQR